jgi:hypothetical protein
MVVMEENHSYGDNHIPALVISPTTTHIDDPTPQTHCTALRTIEDLLDPPPLGCAAGVSSATQKFRL